MPDSNPARQALTERAAALRQRVEALEAHLRNADRELPDDWSERAQVEQGDQVYEAIEATARAELDAIRKAIARLDAGEPALCAACGEPIDERRILAVPTATTCVACA